ncbi:Protein of unknown function [Pyronema omphalodes CBS 100304]|uniref:Uncharacterized protein n=1 Tax=Pyronema omphalodes (strain CBS 100304) TaxID=1076935 RepID=U4KYQ3_PYROM|nr:Protein of unknown function [Pyronema omphalodes CBS 100304]
MYTWCQDKLDSATGNTEYRGIQRAEYNRLVKERFARLERDKPKKNAIKATPDASTSFGLPYVDLSDEEYAKVLQAAEKDFVKRAWKRAGKKADEAQREEKKAKRVVGNI